ncbi:hypothetical protein [Halomarina litorea]|uniref:hypothetical protein n=1 Tax=Halomarina litorea TaxID=2961595 RepID=UPI0020C27719|nr:hypothetical protein [Halomarina sp. BCD28]
MTDADTPLSTIDTRIATLEAVIDDLRFQGRLTADDATELSHRVDSLADGLTACAIAAQGAR